MTWYDITVDQFQKIKGIDLKDLDGQIDAAEILLGINADDMTWVEFSKKCNELNFLDKPIPKTIIRKSYTLNGRKYNCAANLQELSVSRYMDFTNLSKEGKLEKILAVFLIPDGKEYGQDLDQTRSDILTMSIVEAYGIFNFFLLQFQVCYKTLKDFSVGMLKKDKELQKAVSAVMDCSFMLEV